jgi:hypothetical protein
VTLIVPVVRRGASGSHAETQRRREEKSFGFSAPLRLCVSSLFCIFVARPNGKTRRRDGREGEGYVSSLLSQIPGLWCLNDWESGGFLAGERMFARAGELAVQCEIAEDGHCQQGAED